ncbi:MAG: GtrA family protein [Spirulinaceae cyanobacterium]
MNSANSPEPIYVLGAGPAGLATAYTLAKANQPVVVVERDDRVGGLAKSIEYQGFILDYGPHRFYTKLAPVLRLWDEVLGKEQVTVDRLTRIYYQRKYFNYPIQAVETLKTLGLVESLRIVVSYFQSRLFPNNDPHNFAEWVTARFGQRLFEIFFEAYTEKLWGIPCTEISADWAAQRIKGLSLLKAMKNALLGNDGQVKNMINQFQFPRLGSGQLYDRLQAHLEAQGHPVLVNTEVIGVRCAAGQARQVVLRDRCTGTETVANCQGVLSSVPLTLLLTQMLEPAPPERVQEQARSLRFRNTVLVYVMVEGSNLFPDNWLYINEPGVQLGRVTNFTNWSPAMLPNPNQTPLCCEYWADFGDDLWSMAEADLVTLAERDLRQIGLLKNEPVSGGFALKLPRTYPIYAGNYRAALATIQDYVQTIPNLQLIGRYGSFKYNNQDHSLLMGILAAENILEPGKHNLWEVNSDSEYVEEAKAADATTAAEVQRSRRQTVLATLNQFKKYLLTAGSATVVDVLLFAFLTQSGWPAIAALCLSYLVGISVNFSLTRRFVFKVYWDNWLLQYLIFMTVALNGLLANLGLLQILLNEVQLNALLARCISAAAIAVLSFLGHKFYSFALRSPRPFDHPRYPLDHYSDV